MFGAPGNDRKLCSDSQAVQFVTHELPGRNTFWKIPHLNTISKRKQRTSHVARIAKRENEVLTWLLSDHLGSTSVTADATRNLVSTIKYTAFGEIRSGTSSTDYNYTGQRQEVEIGLDYYVARFYDPMLGRFVQADTVVPGAGDAAAYDRYAYAVNNPMRYNDPSGHVLRVDDGGSCTGDYCHPKSTLFCSAKRFIT